MAILGRPTLYTEEIAEQICEHIADGLSLRKICEMDEFPNRATVRRWIRDNDLFRAQYARAHEEQTEYFRDLIRDVAENTQIGETVKIDGDGKTEITRGDMLQHRRLLIDSYKWIMAKQRPKVYGDKPAEDAGEDLVYTIQGGLPD